MKKNVILRIWMVLALVFSLTFGSVAGIGGVKQAQAKTWTKSSVKKEIKSQKKKLKSAQKKYKAEKKKYNKQTKGTFAVLGATTLSYNPLVIRYDGILGINSGYYWIAKGARNYGTLTGGYLKKTGGYKTYNGYTCTVVKCVKVTASPSKYEDKIKKIKTKIKKLNKALSFKPRFTSFSSAEGFYKELDEDGNESNWGASYVGDVVFIVQNQTIDVYDYVTHNAYNELEFSVDVTEGAPDIVSITKDGELTINGSGQFYVDVDCSVSGKRGSLHCIAAVYEEEPEETPEPEETYEPDPEPTEEPEEEW